MRRPKEMVELPVEGQLVRVEVDLGEDVVLGEEVVGDQALAEELLLRQLLLLAVAGQQEEQLRLEGVLVGLVVEPAQKRVVVDLLEDGAGLQLLGEQAGQRRLADSDRALDDDVPGFAHRLPAGEASEYHGPCDESSSRAPPATARRGAIC